MERGSIQENFLLVIVLVLSMVFVVYANSQYQKSIADSESEETTEEEEVYLTSYGYGGVDKTGYLNYEDAVDMLINFYNNADGESLASMIDFAAAAVYNHHGLEDFDDNLYTLVTDAENYKDDYYADSLAVMCAYLIQGENDFIEEANNYNVEMELEDLSDLTAVEGSKYLYECTATINMNDKDNDEEYETKLKITFITYDEQESYYVMLMENAS